MNKPLLIASIITPAAVAGPVYDWNAVVRTDVNITSEFDGSALIGGNITGTGNYAVHGYTASDGTGLALGGTLSGTANVNSGSFRSDGTTGGTVNNAGWVYDNTVASRVAQQMNFWTGVSNVLSGLSATGSVDGGGNMNASTTNIDGYNIAVYNINASSFQSLGQLNLNMGAADTVIINVASDNGLVDFNAPPNLIGGFNQANSAHILWNLYDATDVYVNNSFNGALIATGADLQLRGGGINGTVVVDSISAMNAEIRSNNYSGYLPSVPVPASAGVFAIAGFIAVRRRR